MTSKKKRKRKQIKESESRELPKEKRKKHDKKAAQIAASKSAAELLFSSHRVKEMEDEITKLKQQLKAQENKVGRSAAPAIIDCL